MSMNRKSKFSGLFEPAPDADAPSSAPAINDVSVVPPLKEQAPAVAPAEEQTQETMPAPAQRISRRPAQRAASHRTPSLPASAPPQRASRSGSGKRNNPEYFQATAYIPQQLKEEVDIKMIRAKRRRPDLDFSVLMEELLQIWVNSKD